MEWIANQPVKFSSEVLCNSCDEDIPQLSDNTDTVVVQFKVDSCGSSQLLEDFNDYPYNNWFLGTGWAISNSLLCLSGFEPQAAYQTIAVGTFPTGYYKFTIVVSSYSGTGVPVQVGNSVDGYDVIGTIDGVGTFTFYYSLVQASNPAFPNKFLFNPGEQGEAMCISSNTAYKILTSVKIAVYNELGVYVTEIGYVANPSLFSFYQDTVTVIIKWSTLPVPLSNGCYYMCFLDPCLNTGGQIYPAVIVNPNFTADEPPYGWELGLAAAYSGQNLVMGDSMTSASFTQSGIFSNYANQCVTINIISITGTLTVKFGTAVVATITTTGIHIICGTPIGNLGITFSTIATHFATIDYVRPITITTSSYVCDLQSNNFKLADYTSACTLLISAVNNENGLGFVFTNTPAFTPIIRLDAKLKGMKYFAERSINEDSAGLKNVYYFSGRKAKILAIDLQPEYVHDFLRLLMAFDSWYIDGVLYFVEDDEYSVLISDAHDSIGSVKLIVSTRTQDVKNFNCA